jgi:lipoprotein-anchoring transpeptidase ErfK/SrfK
MRHRTKIAPVTAVATFAALGALLLSGCSASAEAQWSGSPSASGSPGAPSGPASGAGVGEVAIAPAAAAVGVAPGAPVTVTATGAATVTAVTLTHGSTKVAGTMATDGHSWTSTGKLAFGTKYTVTVTAANAAKPTVTSTFTTATASKTVKVSLEANLLNSLKNGGTYGVGQVLIAHFNHAISKSQRDNVVAGLKVTTTPSVEGRWHWVSSTEVDYRGEKYWASGTTLTLDAHLYGVKFSSGVYGANTAKATIHIGDSHIAIADNKSHRMKVYVNGKLVRTVKVSMGMGGSTTGAQGQVVNYWTRNGPHIVLEKSPTVTMSSASYGVSDPHSRYFYAPETVKDDARISYSGEFVHLRDWTVGDIGVRNSSHGCINVGIKDAMYMYNLLRPGDIVDVVNSPVPISFANTQADWSISWSKW